MNRIQVNRVFKNGKDANEAAIAKPNTSLFSCEFIEKKSDKSAFFSEKNVTHTRGISRALSYTFSSNKQQIFISNLHKKGEGYAVLTGVGGKLKCVDVEFVRNNEISYRLQVNFLLVRNKFFISKKFIFHYTKKYFSRVRNIFLTSKKFTADLLEIYGDTKRNKNAAENVFSFNVASSDVLRRHTEAVIAGLTRNPLQICISSGRGLRVKPAMTVLHYCVRQYKPAMTASVVVVCGIKPTMTVIYYCVRQYKSTRTLSVVAIERHNPSFSFYHYYNVAMGNDASILVNSIYRFCGGKSLNNYSFNQINQIERTFI